jgi:hypothetical protein
LLKQAVDITLDCEIRRNGKELGRGFVQGFGRLDGFLELVLSAAGNDDTSRSSTQPDTGSGLDRTLA